MIINRDPRFQLIKICFFLIFTVRFLLLLCCTKSGRINYVRLRPRAQEQKEAGATSVSASLSGRTTNRPVHTNGTTVALALHPARAANQSQVQEPGHGRPGRSERPRPPFGFVLEAAAMDRSIAHRRESLCRARQTEMVEQQLASPLAHADRSLCPARIGLDKSERALEPFRVASPRPHARTLAGSRKG